MKKAPFHEYRVRARLMTAMTAALVVALASCASQSVSDEDLTAGPQCPPNTTMKCYVRASAPDECFCANQGNIENTIETIMRRGPN
jgi:putative hemolysin